MKRNAPEATEATEDQYSSNRWSVLLPSRKERNTKLSLKMSGAEGMVYATSRVSGLTYVVQRQENESKSA